METIAERTASGLGASTTLLLRQLAAGGKMLFTHKEVSKLWQGSRGGLNVLLHRLARGGWIQRLERGKYLIIPLEAGPLGQYTEHEFLIASRLVTPYMIGLWSALNHHGLTEQIPDRVYLISPNAKHRAQGKAAGVSYQVLTVPRERFFGAAFTWIGREKIWVTSLERTLLDAVLWPQHCGGFGEVAKAFREARSRADLAKLSELALKMEMGVAFKRLGLLGEWLRWPRQTLALWGAKMSAGISLLDPAGTRSGPQISRWRLRLNFPLEGFGDRDCGA